MAHSPMTGPVSWCWLHHLKWGRDLLESQQVDIFTMYIKAGRRSSATCTKLTDPWWMVMCFFGTYICYCKYIASRLKVTNVYFVPACHTRPKMHAWVYWVILPASHTNPGFLKHLPASSHQTHFFKPKDCMACTLTTLTTMQNYVLWGNVHWNDYPLTFTTKIL